MDHKRDAIIGLSGSVACVVYVFFAVLGVFGINWWTPLFGLFTFCCMVILLALHLYDGANQ